MKRAGDSIAKLFDVLVCLWYDSKCETQVQGEVEAVLQFTAESCSFVTRGSGIRLWYWIQVQWTVAVHDSAPEAVSTARFYR